MNDIKKLDTCEVSYQKPQVTCVDLESENVLCQSGKFFIDDFEEENDKFLNF
ncbi:MAG: hypothetical protein PUC72_06750 [Bacteroidales bacterium]|nr:hypothetical protein [Bacteroidales bacterium]